METPDKFDFPFDPYPIQCDFMRALFEVIENKKLGIFESPTGTGKSLSIICGAIRWLKEHNSYVRTQLHKEIERLETEKSQIVSNSTDWLFTQSKEIELTHRIVELTKQHNKILEHDKKIENLKEKKSGENRKKPIFTPPLLERDVDEGDDDIVLDTEVEIEEECEDMTQEDLYRPTKIFICSRTHSQLSQLVGEILKSPFAQNIRVASLASRQHYCINPNVIKLKNNSLINEKCLDKQKQSKTGRCGEVPKKQKGDNSNCPYFKQTAIKVFRDLVLTEVQDVEDLVKNGKQLNACPYYTSRLAAEDAEVVLVPYSTILHRATREANGLDIKDNVVIVDEAHNLLEAMAQMHNSELTCVQLEQGLLLMKCYRERFSRRFSAANLLSINKLIFVIAKLQHVLDAGDRNRVDTFTVENFVLTAKIDNYNMFSLVKFCKDSRIAQKVRSYAIKYPFDKAIVEKPVTKGVRDFLASIETEKADVRVETEAFVLSNPLVAIIAFLETLTYTYNDGRIFIYPNEKLQFLLLNPAENFQDIVKLARSVIVAGGTMKPYKEFRDRLFLSSGASPDRIVEFSCGHVVPAQNILPIVVTRGFGGEKLLFNFANRNLMGDSIRRIVLEACTVVPGGIVIFFPSFNYENWVWQRIKDAPFGRPVFREPPDSAAVETVLKSYSDAIYKSQNSGAALLLGVVGGKLSEGLNFSDDLGRCVIVVGLPYANVAAPDLKEKMSYLDKTEGLGAGKRFYEALCMKAVNQSIGRAVRHKTDYATILLLDERYDRVATKNALPDWIQKSLRVLKFKDTLSCLEKDKKTEVTEFRTVN